MLSKREPQRRLTSLVEDEMTIKAARLQEGTRTLAAEVFQRMRADIVSCRLAPNLQLKFEPLKEAYGASFSTLREALTGLVSEGLVASEGQRGFRVAPASRQELQELTDARVLIERELIKLAIEKGNDDWEVEATAALHRMSLLEQRNPSGFFLGDDYRAAHQKFHDVLVNPSGSGVLIGIRASLYARAERYRSLSAIYRKHKRNKVGEHKSILDAVLSRKTKLSQELLENHIRATTKNVLECASDLLV